MLKDVYYPLFVHLGYRVLPDVNLIVQWAEIETRSHVNALNLHRAGHFSISTISVTIVSGLERSSHDED